MPQHTGPMGAPRPLLSCTPPVTFEMEGRVDSVDEDVLSNILDMPVRAEAGAFHDVDLVLQPGDTSIESDQLDELEDTVQNQLANTHTIVGWRIGEL